MSVGAERSGSDWMSAIMVACAVIVTALLAVREGRDYLGDRSSRSPTVRYVKGWESFAAKNVRMGPANAQVVIVEFGDLQCPWCRRFMSRIDSARARYRDTLALVFAHFPLEAHLQAMAAATAAECADKQGKMANFIETAYAEQDSLGREAWGRLASKAGIADVPAFERCVEAPSDFPRIRNDIAFGTSIGVHATPTVLVNGWLLRAAPTTSELDSIVRRLLKGKRPTD